MILINSESEESRSDRIPFLRLVVEFCIKVSYLAECRISNYSRAA